MARMTEEEADALDELWTKTAPKIKAGGRGGFFSEHQAPSEFAASIVRKEVLQR